MPVETWDTRDLPVLKAIADRDDRWIGTSDIAAKTGLGEDVVLRSVRSLKEAGYLTAEVIEIEEEDAPVGAGSIRLLERGKRVTEVWPSEDAGAGFLEAIDVAIANESDEGRRSTLTRLRDAGVAVGRTALGEVVRQLIDRGMSP